MFFSMTNFNSALKNKTSKKTVEYLLEINYKKLFKQNLQKNSAIKKTRPIYFFKENTFNKFIYSNYFKS